MPTTPYGTETPPVLAGRGNIDRRNAVTLKLLFIAALVLLLQVPLFYVNKLRQERSDNRAHSLPSGSVVVPVDTPRGSYVAPEARVSNAAASRTGSGSTATLTDAERAAVPIFEGYRMVERSLKHGILVLALVFTAFFLFEMLAGLKLHAIHYMLVGAALCLFYLALLALGEVATPGTAYVAAAVASSLLIVLYAAPILRSWLRAGLIAGLLATVHSVLFVVLRMEDFALLAGTGALFAALAAVMYFTRNVDWTAQDAGAGTAAKAGATP